MSVAKALAWNTIIQVLGKIVSTAFGVFIVGFLTRYLGQEGFGIYTTANAYLQIFALLLDLGLNVSLVAMLGEHAGDETYERRCVSAVFTLRIVMAVIILGVSPLLWSLLYPSEAGLTMAITALTGAFFFPALNQVVIGVQQRHLKMGASAISENIGRIILVIGLLCAQGLGWGLVPIMWLISLAALGNFAYNIWMARSLGHFRWNWDPAFWKTALARSWPIGVSIAFNLVYFKADTLILSRVRSLTETGVYGAAYRVLEILITVPFLYAGVLLPLLSSALGKKDTTKFAHYISRSIEVMWILAAPMVAGTLALGPQLLSLVAGPEFRESGEIMRVLILAVAIIYINTVYSYGVVAINGQKKMLPIYIVTALITLGGYILFIPKYGMWSAAWLTVISEALIILGNRWVLRREIKSLRDITQLAKITFAAVLMGALAWLIRDTWILLPLLLGAIAYPLFLFLFGALKKETIKELLLSK